MADEKQFTYQEACDYVTSKGKKQKLFYRNIYGWELYYTLQPTVCTPTGAHPDFPRTKMIKP